MRLVQIFSSVMEDDLLLSCGTRAFQEQSFDDDRQGMVSHLSSSDYSYALSVLWVRQRPRLSIRILIWVLPSDTHWFCDKTAKIATQLILMAVVVVVLWWCYHHHHLHHSTTIKLKDFWIRVWKRADPPPPFVKVFHKILLFFKGWLP